MKGYVWPRIAVCCFGMVAAYERNTTNEFLHVRGRHLEQRLAFVQAKVLSHANWSEIAAVSRRLAFLHFSYTIFCTCWMNGSVAVSFT